MKENCFIVGIGFGDHEYNINGVKYVVSSRYVPAKHFVEADQTLSDKLKNYLGGDFADLTIQAEEDIMYDEYADSAAGKED